MTSNKKTIALYIGSLSRGGAERVMVNLAQHFCAHNYNVYLVTKTVDEPEYEVPKGVTRIVADITKEEEGNSRVGNLVKRIKKLRGIWKEINPDLILSFIRKNNLMAIASAKGLKIPVVVGIRSNPARELQGRLMKPLSFCLFGYAKGIVVQTTQGKEYLPQKLQKKTVIMPNSLTKQFMEMPVSVKRRKEIVCVGRIDDNKNQKMLLEAFSKLGEEAKDWSLHLYGDGSAKIGLEKEYASDNIIFHGQVNDVADRIKDASIYVLTSKEEGMPNALIEAMALGLACISTDCPCGGPADLINDGDNGILVPVNDTEALAKALSSLINDENLRDNMGKEAVKVRETLNPTAVNEKWQQYLESVI